MAMSNEASEAFFSLSQAQYAAGDFRTKVIESVTTAEIRTLNRIDNVAGVKLPVFTEVEVSREKSDNIGLSGGGGKIQNCREKFRVLLRALIKLASLQVRVACRHVDLLHSFAPKFNAIGVFMCGRVDTTDLVRDAR